MPSALSVSKAYSISFRLPSTSGGAMHGEQAEAAGMILDHLGAVLVELAREPARLLEIVAVPDARAARSTGSRWRSRSCPCPRATAAGDHFGGGGPARRPGADHGVDVELRDEVVMHVDARSWRPAPARRPAARGRGSRRRPARARPRRRRGNSAAPGLPVQRLTGSQHVQPREKFAPTGWACSWRFSRDRIS